jgi:hypothetical protein
MTINKLYRFINRSLNTLPIKQHLDKGCFHFKVDSEQHNYVLYELAMDNCRIATIADDQQYILKSHHISFYEMQNDKNPCLSQYHYTAYLEDKNKQKYQLHVHFDQNDQLTTSAILSIEDDNGLYVQQKISPKFTNGLAQLAIDKSFRFMSELRAQYQNSLNNLETRYNELEQELRNLSCNLVANRDSYLAKLKIIIEVLTQLSDYRPQYGVLINLFTRFEKYLQATSETPNISSSDDKFIEKRPHLEIVGAYSKKIAPVNTKKSIQKFIQQALKYQDGFLALPEKTPYEDQLKSFLLFLESTQNALIATEDDDYYFTSEDLQNIQTLMSNSTAEAKKLLTHLLLTNNFHLAEALKHFASPVADKLIKLALVKGNAKILDFLLNNSDFPINTFLIADNLSPVLFCFIKHKEETPKIECLSVLIKHNASIMVKTNDGLSVAHHIMNTIHHPLKKALDDNKENTLGHPQFYKTLIGEIEAYLNQSDINETNKNKLLVAIEQYELAFKLLEKGSSIMRNQIARNRQGDEQLTNYYEKSVLETLREDKEIQQKFSEYKEVCKIFTRKVSKRELCQLTNQGNQIFHDLNDVTKITGINEDISVIKTMTLQVFNDFTKILTLKSQLIDIQQNFKKMNSKKVNSKKINALYKQQREILNELKPLQIKYQTLDNNEIITLKINIKKSINEIKTEMQEFSDLLSTICDLSDSILPALIKNRTKAFNASNYNLTAEDLTLANSPIEYLISSTGDDSIDSSQSSENNTPIPKI